MHPHDHRMELTIDGDKYDPVLYTTSADAKERQRLIGVLLRCLRVHEFPEKAKTEGTVAHAPRLPNVQLSSTFLKPKLLESLSIAPIHDTDYPYTGTSLGGRLLTKSSPCSLTAVQNTTEFVRWDALRQPVFSGASGATVSRTWTNSRVGTTVASWRRKIESGANATGVMSATRIKMKVTPGYRNLQFWSSSYGKPWLQTYDVIGGSIVPSVPSASTDAAMTSRIDTSARRKLFKKISALKRQADVGESLAEYRQALTMIGKPLAGIQQLVRSADARGRALARASKRQHGTYVADDRAKALSKAAGLTWLEFWFGFYPLAKDIEAVIKAVNEKRSKIGVTKITASFKDGKVLTDSTNSTPQLNYNRYIDRSVVRLDVNVRYHMGINPVAIDTDSLLKQIGLSLDRFIPTVYAVIPYSWLFDYFTGLNQTIDALCEDISFKTWTCKTVRSVKTESWVRINDNAKTAALLGQYLISDTGAPWMYYTERVDVARSIPTDLVPPPQLGIPGSWKPYANIVALLASRIKVTRRGFAV